MYIHEYCSAFKIAMQVKQCNLYLVKINDLAVPTTGPSSRHYLPILIAQAGATMQGMNKWEKRWTALSTMLVFC